MPRILRGLILFPLALASFTRAQTPAQPFNVVGATIAETQTAIREGRTTCRAVVESYLARIQAYDQRPIDGLRLNAIVLVNPNALAEADACDRSFAATHKLLPLSGIAVLIKDNYDTAGLQTTGGSLAMKGFVPQHDAPMVAKLRAAGAILLAKTNMAEWAFSPYLTASSISGITRNPYDLTRVPAGSSGGTAAAVSASRPATLSSACRCQRGQGHCYRPRYGSQRESPWRCYSNGENDRRCDVYGHGCRG